MAKYIVQGDAGTTQMRFPVTWIDTVLGQFNSRRAAADAIARRAIPGIRYRIIRDYGTMVCDKRTTRYGEVEPMLTGAVK